MYKVMLVFNDYWLMDEIRNMDIWGASSGFEIASIQNNGVDALEELRRNKYDLLITEIFLTKIDGLQLLRTMNNESIECSTVLCSEAPSFAYAREGIILGAYDYFVKPFETKMFTDMLERLKNKLHHATESAKDKTDNIAEMFESYNPDLIQNMKDLFAEIINRKTSCITACREIHQIYSDIIDEIFSRNRWLEAYVNHDSFLKIDYITQSRNSDECTGFYIRKIQSLFDEYCSLLPSTNIESVKNIILYIVDQPEGDLTLKLIAERFHMNPSYLSTIFATSTGVRFIDYLALIRMKRAKWLIMNTPLKVAEVAHRLSYKDEKYFSRIFKQHFGALPNEYRVSEYDNYEI